LAWGFRLYTTFGLKPKPEKEDKADEDWLLDDYRTLSQGLVAREGLAVGEYDARP